MPLEDIADGTAKKNNKAAFLNRATQMPEAIHVSTGVFILDLALNGGIPENMVMTATGQPGGGKTTEGWQIAKQFQKKYDGVNNPKKYCVYVDCEQQFGVAKPWAESIGVNLDDLWIATPLHGGDACDLIIDLYKDPDVAFIILDSVPSLVNPLTLEKSVEDKVMADVANLLQPMLKNVSSEIARRTLERDYCTMYMINSYREKPGVVYGDPRTLPGGKFATFYASTHVDFSKQKADQDKNENDVVTNFYNNHAFRIVKQRTGTSITEGEFSIVASPATGMKPGTVDDWGTVFKYATNFNLAGGAGQGWWIADPETGELGKFKSKTLAVEFLKENEVFNDKMKKKIISLHRKSQGLRENGWC